MFFTRFKNSVPHIFSVKGSVSQQGQQGSAGFAQNEARSGEARSGSSEDSDDEGVMTNTSDQPSDPNRIFDAYA